MCHKCVFLRSLTDYDINVLLQITIVGCLLFLFIGFIEWLIGPIVPQLELLWLHMRARYRVRARVIALLDKRAEREWETFCQSGLDSGFWSTLPSFMVKLCHSKRVDFVRGYELAIAAMDQDFDANFAVEIEEEKKFIVSGKRPEKSVVEHSLEKPVPVSLPPACSMQGQTLN